MEPDSAEAIRMYVLKNYIEPARKKGQRRIQVTAGDVHRGMHLKNRVSNVCSALGSRAFLKDNGLVVDEMSGPPSGMSTRVAYTYLLVENKGSADQANTAHDFENLRGLLKEALHSLGGGEAFLRRERERFHEADRSDNK